MRNNWIKQEGLGGRHVQRTILAGLSAISVKLCLCQCRTVKQKSKGMDKQTRNRHWHWPKLAILLPLRFWFPLSPIFFTKRSNVNYEKLGARHEMKRLTMGPRDRDTETLRDRDTAHSVVAAPTHETPSSNSLLRNDRDTAQSSEPQATASGQKAEAKKSEKSWEAEKQSSGETERRWKAAKPTKIQIPRTQFKICSEKWPSHHNWHYPKTWSTHMKRTWQLWA